MSQHVRHRHDVIINVAESSMIFVDYFRFRFRFSYFFDAQIFWLATYLLQNTRMLVKKFDLPPPPTFNDWAHKNQFL